MIGIKFLLLLNFSICLLANEVFDRVTVETEAGFIRGQFVSNSYYSFKGIPYGEPPVGNLRFRDPVPRQPWNGVRDTLKHGNFCPNKFGFFGLTQQAGGAEDCLFLNVYTPSLSGERAVMFWIHGGAFMSGNGDSLLYGPDHLVLEDVVLVTINYRYSYFGFLSTDDENAPGNQGMKDIVLALEWVRKNVDKFGGDKEKVTIFGHSSGSVAVSYLMLSDLSNGLFQQAILQSGAALMDCLFQPDPRANAELLGNRLGLKFNSTKQLIEELQKVNYTHIVEAESQLFSMEEPWGLRPFEFVPSVDFASPKNKFLNKTPEEIFLSKKYREMPIMVGSTSFEGMFITLLLGNPEVVSKYNQHPEFLVPLSFNLQPNKCNSEKLIGATNILRNFYFDGKDTGSLEQWLKYYSDGVFRFPADRAIRFYADNPKVPIYYYEFAFDGSLNYFKKFFNLNFEGASHADELFYLFEPELSGFVPDENSTLVRNRMTKMWANFAKFGNPTPEKNELITEIWKTYSHADRNYMQIGLELRNRQNPISVNFLSDLQKNYTGHY